MEGFCRGCLIKYDEPMELLQYTEKNRRLFVYSTGLQVKRNDTFTFQLCKDCFLNMKQACKFKKNCRTSDKRFRNYVALKDVGDPVDFCTFLKNSDDTLTFRLPMTSGSSTPATQKCRDDDNDSTCTSIRNFMTDILQGEEMPDTEARIIKEVIEEEADVLDDSLDSHWLQDDMSIDTDFRLDFSFSPFSTPRTVNNDHCYTPKQKDDQETFDTINTEKQTKILNDFTNAFKTDENIEELSIYVGGSNTHKTESFKNLKEFGSSGSINETDGTEKSQNDSPKNKRNLKELISDLDIDEIDGMDTSDSKIEVSDQNLIELRDLGIEEPNDIHEAESNESFKELCNFDKDETDGIENSGSNAVKGNQSLKDLISNLAEDEIEGIGKPEKTIKSNKILNDLIGNFGKDTICAFGKPDSNTLKSSGNVKELCDFSLDSFSGAEKTENRIHKNVLSLKELCDFSLDSSGSLEKPANSIVKNNQSLKELYDLSLNSFDDAPKSVSNTFKNDQIVKENCDLSLNDFDDIANSGTFKNETLVKDIICDFGINDIEKSETSFDLPSLPDTLEKDKTQTDFEIPKGVIGFVQSNNDVSNSSINIEALINDKPCTIDANLEEALKNTDTKEFSLENLLVSPRGFPAASAASTPTITNILFGEKLDTPDTKINPCIEPYYDVQGDTEIFEEFFQNDTKEFDVDDFIRENGAFKSERWKKPVDINVAVVDNKENESKNIEMDISTDDKDQVDDNHDIHGTVIKKEPIICISHTTNNDKFDIEQLYCKLCSIKYDSGRALSVHFLKYHNIKIVKPKTWKSINDTSLIESKSEASINFFDTSDDKFDIETSYCKLCNIKYETGRALSVHFSKTHNIKIIKPPKRIKAPNSNVTKLKTEDMIKISDGSRNDKFDKENLFCKLCRKKYKTDRALSRHLSLCHNIKIVKPEYDTENMGYQLCNNCGTNCKDAKNFARHLKICQSKGSQVFQCDRCLQEFMTQKQLEKHKTSHTQMKRKKVSRKEYVCSICGAIFNKQSNFVLHTRRHTKDYCAKCEYCDKGFYRQSDLKSHLRSHTGDTPFSCKFCPKLFTRKDVLSRHIRIHLNERMFECDYCGLKCIKKYDLIQHIQNNACRRVKTTRKRKRNGKKVMDIDVTEKLEEKDKEKIEESVQVTVIYAKGSDASIKKQLPFLETEKSN